MCVYTYTVRPLAPTWSCRRPVTGRSDGPPGACAGCERSPQRTSSASNSAVVTRRRPI